MTLPVDQEKRGPGRPRLTASALGKQPKETYLIKKKQDQQKANNDSITIIDDNNSIPIPPASTIIITKKRKIDSSNTTDEPKNKKPATKATSVIFSPIINVQPRRSKRTINKKR
jgi:hypothetical protein